MGRTKPTITFNGGAIKGAALRAFQITMIELGETFQEVIEEVGAFSDFPQSDIVDTGDLRDSQQIKFPQPGAVKFDWSVEYAPYVHEGYILQNGNTQSGRPWTKVGLSRFNVQMRYAENLNQELKQVKNKRSGVGKRRDFQRNLNNFSD
ncbi:MAG: hypothetical protein EAZ18_00205 [Oscillatoriales cyanobacterium]|nr:MAG: hypothetical protein EAZ18_00205 [Oscillatoriales cyanobacterium]